MANGRFAIEIQAQSDQALYMLAALGTDALLRACPANCKQTKSVRLLGQPSCNKVEPLSDAFLRSQMNASLRQSGRLGRLSTALGPDVLVLLRFDGTDYLNELFEYRVEALSTHSDLDFNARPR